MQVEIRVYTVDILSFRALLYSKTNKELNKAKNKIFFVSPFVTDPKKIGPTQKKLFHDLEIFFFFFLFTEIYTFSLGLFFITLLFFHIILLQTSKFNTVLNI